MSEPLPEEMSSEPVTVDSMATDLRALGVEAGDTVLVHGSLSALGWVCGGAPAVVDALQRVVGTEGTVGVGDATLLSQPRLVDFAVEWFERNRES